MRCKKKSTQLIIFIPVLITLVYLGYVFSIDDTLKNFLSASKSFLKTMYPFFVSWILPVIKLSPIIIFWTGIFLLWWYLTKKVICECDTLYKCLWVMLTILLSFSFIAGKFIYIKFSTVHSSIVTFVLNNLSKGSLTLFFALLYTYQTQNFQEGTETLKKISNLPISHGILAILFSIIIYESYSFTIPNYISLAIIFTLIITPFCIAIFMPDKNE